MKTTRFMQVMFSNNDEELADQVDNDIKSAQDNGEVDTDEVNYKHVGDGNVAITDKENGEVTIAQAASDAADTYDLIAVPDGQLEKFLHPSVVDGSIKVGNQVGASDENVKNHFSNGSVISPNLEDGGLNPSAGHERKVAEMEEPCPECGNEPCTCGDEGEKEFSVSTDNTVVQRIFSDQEFCERIFSEVIESEDTAKVGDLKIEKVGDEDNAVVVTDETTGDQAKVELDNENMNVTELDSKTFSNDEQFMPLFVVGVDTIDHVIVDAPEYSQESADELAQQLTEDGVDAVQIFDNQEEARDYAINLLNGLGVKEGDVEEPVQAEYSDHDVFFTSYVDDNTDYMCRMFSETVDGVSEMQDTISDAIDNGDQIETDDEVITPVDAQNAVIEDKNTGETTKATLTNEDVKLEKISPEEAKDITEDLSVIEDESNIKKTMAADAPGATAGDGKDEDESEDDEDEDEGDEEEKECSEIYTDDSETRFFSENEEFTDYMVRVYSDVSDQNEIESAIEEGDQVENDTEVITPVDSKTAVVEDKANGEFTKATITDEDTINLHPISEDEADNLTEDLAVEDNEEDLDEAPAEGEEDAEEKECSEIYTDEAETKFFSENEEFTDYMLRLFSEEADQDEIEDAIASGDQIENESEVITPVDAKTAVIEDKANGEFTKATIDNEDEMSVDKIDEDEADELTDGLAVEDNEKDEDKKFSYSDDRVLDKFFADIAMNQVAPAAPGQVPAQAAVPTVQNEQGNEVPVQVDPTTGQVAAVPVAPTVEEAEDKAEAAIQGIQAAAADAAATIAEAKAAPAASAEPDLQEATFSDYDYEAEERTFSDNENSADTLVSWLGELK